jgi:hypothetical protein
MEPRRYMITPREVIRRSLFGAFVCLAGCGRSGGDQPSPAEQAPHAVEKADPAVQILNSLRSGLSGRWRSDLTVASVEDAGNGRYTITIDQRSFYEAGDDGYRKNWFLDPRYRLAPSDSTTALVWSLAFGYGFAISENANPEPAFSGRKWGTPVSKVAHDAVEASVNKMFAYTQVFDGIGSEKIGKIVLRNYVGEQRDAKDDEYGHRIQGAATRVKLLDECTQSAGAAGRFDWPNISVSYMNQSGWSIPDSVAREAKKATKCTLVNAAWSDWSES